MDLHQIIVSVIQLAQENSEHIAPVVESAAHAKESDSVLGTLGINWKLFLAQLVNFSIVLFIFWKWIVKPLGKTLTDRQEKIESGLKNAELIEQEKAHLVTQKLEEMRQARVEAERVIKSATDTANKMKQEIINEAQAQSSRMMEQTKSQMEQEKQNMLKEVHQEVATLVVAASEKILRGKLDMKKDNELIKDSIAKTK